MFTILDPSHVELSRAIVLYDDAGKRAAPYIKELEEKKQAVERALGAVIVQFVQEFGVFCESEDKTWYRTMPCNNMPNMPGFEEVVETTFGHINWINLYRPALEGLDRTKAYFSFGHGECFVTLNEKLSEAEKCAIEQHRDGTFT